MHAPGLYKMRAFLAHLSLISFFIRFVQARVSLRIFVLAEVFAIVVRLSAVEPEIRLRDLKRTPWNFSSCWECYAPHQK